MLIELIKIFQRFFREDNCDQTIISQEESYPQLLEGAGGSLINGR